MDWKRYSLPMLVVGIAFLFSCGGGGGVDDPNHFGDPNGNQGIEGNVTPPPNPADFPQTGTITGALGSAPLGTDPAYGVQEASDTIITNLVNGTSSVRGTSQDEGRIFWVAVVKHGETPVEGQSVPPLFEGDDIDLYMRYQVYDFELTVSRTWYMDAAGLEYIEPAVVHPQAGIYEATFTLSVPYGSAGLEAKFIGAIDEAFERSTSVLVVDDMDAFAEVDVDINEVPTTSDNWPTDADDTNDEDGCLPDSVEVVFEGTTVVVTTEGRATSNIVGLLDDLTHVRFEPGSEDMTQTFEFPSQVLGVWVKAGCNVSGEGPGYGEWFPNLVLSPFAELAMSQFAWNDTTESSDLDYNDFVGRMRVTETFVDGNLAQALIVVKASARAAVNEADWQFNVGAAFPGNQIYAIVDQYYADGIYRHGDQRIYVCNDGVSIPVFTPIRDALPNPNDASGNEQSRITNGLHDTSYVDGDFAVITLIFRDTYVGTYTPPPYNPELKVYDVAGVFTIPIWTGAEDTGGEFFNSAGYPHAFFIEDTYPWTLDGVSIETAYSGFSGWTGNAPMWWDQYDLDTTNTSSVIFNRGDFPDSYYPPVH